MQKIKGMLIFKSLIINPVFKTVINAIVCLGVFLNCEERISHKLSAWFVAVLLTAAFNLSVASLIEQREISRLKPQILIGLIGGLAFGGYF